MDADAGFTGGEDGVVCWDGEDVFELLADGVWVGGREVDFVDDWDNFEALVDGEVGIGDGLGFDALGGVDEEEGAFAGCEGSRDFVGEVYVAGGVDEVEEVFLAGFGGVAHGDWVAFDGDAAFAFEVHGVKVLGFHVAFLDGLGVFEEAI